MELKIDLSDREEIAAAVPLLQLILENTKPHKCRGDGQCSKAAPFPPIDQADTLIAAVAETTGVRRDMLLGKGGDTETAPYWDALNKLHADPAAVFGKDAAGQIPPFLQSAAPFTAVANPSSTTPVGTLATSLITPSNVPLPPAPPAPGPVAQTASDVAPTNPANSVETDVNGLPWDERIHASSKAKIASGAWRYKRGVEPADVQRVEAELRGPTISMGVTLPTTPDSAQNHAETVRAPLPPRSPEADHQAAIREVAERRALAMADVTTFGQLMPRATAAVIAGKLPIMAVQDACTANGIVSIVALQQTPALIPAVWATLKQTYPEL